MPSGKGSSKSSDKSRETLLRLLDKRVSGGKTLLSRLDDLQVETGAPVHAELLRLVAHLNVSNDIARKVWSGTQLHRVTIKKRLGRDPGARVALFDYLSNVDKRFTNPKIIELSDFDRTERSAITDHLTGLFNRAHFDISLSRELNRCRRYGQTASLVMLDLDNFKQINDTYGHPMGDKVLKEVGRLMTQRVRDIDVAARYGGEEFAIILPETGRKSAYVVAERIRSEVERSFKKKRTDGRAVRMTLSGGVATFPDDADTEKKLLARADEALYRAKNNAKNEVDVYYREKRKAIRIDVLARKIRVKLDHPMLNVARAVNISENGILLESQHPLQLGQNLTMSLPLAAESTLNVTGEVVRLAERQTTRNRRIYDAGVRFQFGRSRPRALSRFLRESNAPEA